MSTTTSAAGEVTTVVPLSALEHDTGIWIFITTIHTLGASLAFETMSHLTQF